MCQRLQCRALAAAPAGGTWRARTHVRTPRLVVTADGYEALPEAEIAERFANIVDELVANQNGEVSS